MTEKRHTDGGGEFSPEFPDELAESTKPFIIGVRHHSAALTAAIPKLLDDAKPDAIFLEAPVEFEGWFGWLQRPETETPIAMSSGDESGGFSMYPFAEFSPEWATIRWAGENDVPIVPFDISVELPGSDGSRVFDHVDLGKLWDRVVEGHASVSTAEQLRRAALRVGYALRSTATKSERDLARETWMRKTLQESKAKKPVAVVGSFHAAALLEEPLFFEPVEVEYDATKKTVSMIRYNHTLLDERSGYPAGVRDPEWHQEVLRSLNGALAHDELLRQFAVKVCRRLREKDQGGPSVDAVEIVRLANGLATLRGLPQAGRIEFVEAVETVLTQGSKGRVRIVAQAMENTMIGSKVGRLPDDVPRCGLSKSMDGVFEALKLPQVQKEMRLDPLRSELDRKRHVTFRRMDACSIRYATYREGTFVAGLPTIQQKWDVDYTPSTEASISLAGLLGVTLEQATEGSLRRRLKIVPPEERSHAFLFELFCDACETGLNNLAESWFQEWSAVWETEATLSLLLSVDQFIGQLSAGQIIAIPSEETGPFKPLNLDYDSIRERLVLASHRVLSGIVGSDQPSDAIALTEIVYRDKENLLLQSILKRMLEEGSPLMNGAAAALSVVVEMEEFETLPTRLASWIDGASTPDLRADLAARLTGVLTAAVLMFETHPDVVDVFHERVSSLDDSDFLGRLPALRKGFSALNEHHRKRLMALLEDRGVAAVDEVALEPEWIIAFGEADLKAKEKLESDDDFSWEPEEAEASKKAPTRNHDIPVSDRWRLILGQTGGSKMNSRAARAAIALDQLYGDGGGVKTGFGGGQEDAFPTTRDWADELADLFGENVREEVLADAAGTLPAAALELNPDSVRPSVDLLQTILPLAGSMSEAQLEKIRPLIQRCVQQLTEMLANRMKPALSGAISTRPTRRRTRRLDVARTVKKNLDRVTFDSDDNPSISPEKFIFRAPQKKSLEWDLYFIVDVSGSMEPSVIYSAIVSAILTGVPWVNLKFLAFNTEVIDLTEFTGDPLALLLEVRIGGGTNIGKAMRYAANEIRVPARSIVMVLSDFEEGFSATGVLDAARHLNQSGVKTLGLASLDDSGKGRYNAALAKRLVSVGMPVAALSPSELARWVKEQVQ